MTQDVPVNPRKPRMMPTWCGWCGKAFTVEGYVYRSRSKAGQRRFFCGSSCSGKNSAAVRDKRPIRRKPAKIMWVVFYHGPGSTNPTMDMRAVWHTKTAALFAISRAPEPMNYTAEKYRLEDKKGAK